MGPSAEPDSQNVAVELLCPIQINEMVMSITNGR